MSAEPVLTSAAAEPPRVPRTHRPALVRFGRGLLQQTLLDPIAEGRLRDVDWPTGLRSVVAAGYLMFAAAAVLVVLSGVLRRHGTLVISGNFGIGMPAAGVWPMMTLLSFGLALLLAAALHGPWWLKVLALLLGLTVLGTWCLRGTSGLGPVWWVWIGVAVLVALVVVVVLRWRRRFAWWELGVFWLLFGAGMAVGAAENRYAKKFGFDFNVLLLQETASLLGYLALPAATVAGASVAEISVRAAVAATRNATRLSHRRWPYVILAVALAGRGVQTVHQFLGRDRVSQGLVAYGPALVLLAGFALVGAVLLRLSRRHGSGLVISELGEELSAVAFPVAAGLVGLAMPLQLGLGVLQVLVTLDPTGPAAALPLNTTPLVTAAVDPVRVGIGVLLVVLAVRAARRGRAGRALVLGCTGVMLIVLARALLLGGTTAAPLDQDVLGTVASLVVLVAIVASLLRRRLTARRALAFAGVLVLGVLFSYRDFISDPLGILLGFSGAALVLFGLTWDLFTGSGWGNRSSRRFPRPARVLLVLTNAVLTMAVLAYAALVRDGSTTIYLDPYAELGNLVFGTALLAAAVVAIIDTALADRPVA